MPTTITSSASTATTKHTHTHTRTDRLTGPEIKMFDKKKCLTTRHIGQKKNKGKKKKQLLHHLH